MEDSSTPQAQGGFEDDEYFTSYEDLEVIAATPVILEQLYSCYNETRFNKTFTIFSYYLRFFLS